jgi:2-keto-4-pentenoate hydratase/2-oxohepta-3-ene-1,7-dioic acid hydratase in catechol pathway
VAFRFGPGGEFDAVTLAIDLTARDLQNKLKAQGHPWTLAKSFRDACLMGAPVTLPKNLEDIAFELKINGERRQIGNTRDMIHTPEKLRRYVLERFPVVEGDYLLTGTPAGVGPVHAGDQLEAEIPGVLKASWRAANS